MIGCSFSAICSRWSKPKPTEPASAQKSKQAPMVSLIWKSVPVEAVVISLLIDINEDHALL
jgi:hypothetical protein